MTHLFSRVPVLVPPRVEERGGHDVLGLARDVHDLPDLLGVVGGRVYDLGDHELLGRGLRRLLGRLLLGVDVHLLLLLGQGLLGVEVVAGLVVLRDEKIRKRDSLKITPQYLTSLCFLFLWLLLLCDLFS